MPAHYSEPVPVLEEVKMGSLDLDLRSVAMRQQVRGFLIGNLNRPRAGSAIIFMVVVSHNCLSGGTCYLFFSGGWRGTAESKTEAPSKPALFGTG